MSDRAEEIMQAEQVMWFRDEYKKGILWANDNNSVSSQQAMAKRSKGMLKGASDLMYFNNGILMAIENKIIGTTHNRIHLLEQIEFGKEIEKQGGKFFFCFSFEQFRLIIQHSASLETEYWIDKIQNSKNKSFKFD